MKWFASIGALLWAVHWLLPYLRSWRILQPFFEVLDGSFLLELAGFAFRWGMTFVFLWYLVQWFMLWIQIRRRQNPSGEPAQMDDEIIDAANERLTALQEACDGPDPFAVRALDVRVQVFTPAADLPKRDGLLAWEKDGTAVIPLNSKQSIHLVAGREGPAIIGAVDAGTAAQPSYKEVSCPLESHVPLVIRRGEGSESRAHFAITRLRDKQTDSRGERYD